MNTSDFKYKPSSEKLNETLYKKFGTKINLEKYDRAQLENYRNILRTKLSQTETSANFNDLLTNETYQRDKFMLDVLNAKIKEMLGESKKTVSEAPKSENQRIAAAIALDAKRKHKKLKPGTASAEMAKMSTAELRKYAKKPKGKELPDKVGEGTNMEEATMKKTTTPKKTKRDDNLANNAKPYDKITRGDVISGRLGKDEMGGKNVEEEFDSTDVNEAKEKWIQKAIKKPGALKKQLSVKKGKKIPAGKLAAAAKKGGKLGQRARLAKTLSTLKEGIEFYLTESEEEKAQIIAAGLDMIEDFTSWMQRIGQYQTKTSLEMGDDIRNEWGMEKASQFKQSVSPSLQTALDTLSQVREQLSAAVAVLAGEDQAAMPMGMDAEMPADMNMPAEAPAPEVPSDADEFSASDAAAGGAETAGRERRESREYTKMKRLEESHSILTKLAS